MIKPILLALVMASLPAYAEDASVAQDIVSVKRSVLELNKDLYELEESLLSPATTRVAFYFSLLHGEFFEPLSVELSGDGLPPVQHIYTERQVSALRMGAVQPLAEINMGPGKHHLHGIVRGVDQQGQKRELIIDQQVEKTDKPLLLEIVVSDDSEKQTATAEVRNW